MKETQIQNMAIVKIDDLINFRNELGQNFNLLILKMQVLEAKLDKLTEAK